MRHLGQVDAERERRARLPALAAAVESLKLYQQQRFSHTYADLLESPRYGPGSRFFLDELYGPRDFSERDAQFARVVPALVRLFPEEIVDTVDTLAQLHAVSESLDSAMATHLPGPVVDPSAYIQAWQATGRAADREAQIALTLQVGAALDQYTRKPLLRHTLRAMRGPARAAGLGALQNFLEAGFETFRAMRGAGEFLSLVGRRERELASALFNSKPLDAAALQQLP